MVAMADPLNFFAIDDIKLYTKMGVIPCLATGADLERVIERYYSSILTQKALNEFSDACVSSEDDSCGEEEILEVTTAPIVKLINSIIEQAVKLKHQISTLNPIQRKSGCGLELMEI